MERILYKLKLPANCPVANAQEQEAILYRIIKSATFQDEDLLSHKELYPHRLEFENLCEAHAISLFDSLEKAMLMAKKNSSLGTSIAKLVIKPQNGKLYIKKRHANLWLYKNIGVNEIKCLEISSIT